MRLFHFLVTLLAALALTSLACTTLSLGTLATVLILLLVLVAAQVTYAAYVFRSAATGLHDPKMRTKPSVGNEHEPRVGHGVVSNA